MRVLAPAAGRHGGRRPLNDLEQGLLDALTRDVAGDRRVLRLATDLVDLVDVDDALLSALDVAVGGLDELEKDVLHVLADIPRLGQSRGIDDGEGDVEEAGQGSGQVSLTGSGGPQQQDVGLAQLQAVPLGHGALLDLDALVVVVDRHAHGALGSLLADDVLVEEVEDLLGLGQLERNSGARVAQLLVDDLIAQLDALVADVDTGPGDELLDLLLALAAEGALEQIHTLSVTCHSFLQVRHRPPAPGRSCVSLRAQTAGAPRAWRRVQSAICHVGRHAARVCWTYFHRCVRGAPTAHGRERHTRRQYGTDGPTCIPTLLRRSAERPAPCGT